MLRVISYLICQHGVLCMSVLHTRCKLLSLCTMCTCESKGKKMVSTGLGVIGDIGKKTYNILMEDDEDSHAATKTNVCTPFSLN